MSFGRRLQEERTRLGLSQEEFAQTGGIRRTSQHLYEKDVRSPDAAYLARIFAAGVDVGYLITGRQTPVTAGGPVIAVAQALSALRAVHEFEDKRGEAMSQQERERMFEFACGSMAGESGSFFEQMNAKEFGRAG